MQEKAMRAAPSARLFKETPTVLACEPVQR
jgi:hypothetical protein